MEVGPVQCYEIVVVKKGNCKVSKKEIEKITRKFIPLINKELKALTDQ